MYVVHYQVKYTLTVREPILVMNYKQAVERKRKNMKHFDYMLQGMYVSIAIMYVCMWALYTYVRVLID